MVAHGSARPEPTPPERICAGTDLASREAVIERGLATFVEVGTALAAIRDERQYRESGWTNFEDYCQARWKFGRNFANKTIAAAETAALVGTDVPVPNEAVARELAPLRVAPERAQAAWAETVERHGPTPTAAQVREVVRQAEPYMEPREKDEKGRPLDVHYVHADSADLQLRVIALRHLIQQADRLLEPRDRSELMQSIELARYSLNDIEQILRPAGLRIVDGGQA